MSTTFFSDANHDGVRSVGDVDLYFRLDEKEYPLHAALKLVSGIKQTPLCEGCGLKHTLRRRVFQSLKAQWIDR